MSRRNPWSQPIDYSVAIQNDIAAIVLYERLAPLCAARPAEPTKYGMVDPLALALFDESVRNAMKLSETDIRCAIAVADWDNVEVETPDDWYYRGEDVLKYIHEFVGGTISVPTEAQRVKWLRHARTSLARHKRNAAKYGRAS